MNQVRALTEDDLKTLAPSIFAQNPISDVSNRYQFIPTFEVVKRLQNEGWLPTSGQESHVRNQENQGYQKHLIRFQRQDLILNGETIEVVLINSHDRSVAYQLMAGVFRFVCSNGMIVRDTFGRIPSSTSISIWTKLLQLLTRLLRTLHRLPGTCKTMKEIELNDSEKKIYAESAALTLYGKSDSIPFDTSRLLTPRRYDDHNKNDLWSTFNIVQENMMKGGLRGLKRDTGGNLRRITTRKIRSIDNDVKLRMVMPRSCRKANQQVPYMGKIFKYGD